MSLRKPIAEYAATKLFAKINVLRSSQASTSATRRQVIAC